MTVDSWQPEDYQLVENKPVYQGFFSMHKLRLKHQRFAGDWTPVMSRELLYRGQAVGVLAYDPRLDQVVMVEQFRVGALQNPQGPWLIELIAGLVETGERPEEVAKREAFEEAGLEIQALEQLFTYFSSPGGTDEEVILFLGIVDASNAGGVHGLEDENEDILVRVMTREEAFAEACRGRAANSMSLIGLQWLQANFQRLQQEYPR
ncbi:ADP-ribose pyrophosphatase [Marinospirillum celere]|uniref:ADP-ribose pyrophosphatase n=1 Tax=Marinospirillum celere TaxID=1122252 RepID=A0A1I1FLQ4_9GAMM|nr:NUDIX domain-containing protein [Marinospirillum celere]SFC00235.1 ADP-ribose pyrophosphatase [Marinospirillum celere]